MLQRLCSQSKSPIANVTSFANFFRRKPSEVKSLFGQVDVLLRLLLVVPASSATAERSFSCLRRLKTFLRSTMSQSRLNHLAVLHVHQDRTDVLDLQAVFLEFVAKNDHRKRVFGNYGFKS
jgi:hAT family C-terminal dimerisation region